MIWLGMTFTPNEAAALAQLPIRRVRKELEHEVIHVPSPPRLPFSALVFFEALRLSGLSWTVEDRARLYRLVSEAVSAEPPPEVIDLTSVLTLRVGPIVRRMDELLVRFYEWKRTLVTDPEVMGGETVFPQSRLTVRHIGEMLRRGETQDVILDDYPYLAPQDIEFAPLFAKAYPRVGRPPREDQASD